MTGWLKQELSLELWLGSPENELCHIVFLQSFTFKPTMPTCSQHLLLLLFSATFGWEPLLAECIHWLSATFCWVSPLEWKCKSPVKPLPISPFHSYYIEYNIEIYWYIQLTSGPTNTLATKFAVERNIYEVCLVHFIIYCLKNRFQRNQCSEIPLRTK